MGYVGINIAARRYARYETCFATRITVSDGPRIARFERALLPHLDAAHNLARWLLGNPHDAEDVVQDAFVRALTFFDAFHGEDGRGWLLAIIRNTCYDFLRKRNRVAQVTAAVEE